MKKQNLLYMKKLTALCLSLAMIFATIIVTAVPVSAASDSDPGNKELTVSYTYENEFENERSYTINVYHKNESGVFGIYHSIVTFEVIHTGGLVENETVIGSKTVTSWLRALSFKQICSPPLIDINQERKEIRKIIEEIYDIAYYIACDQIIKDMSDASEDEIRTLSIQEFKDTIDAYVEEYSAENTAIKQFRSVCEVLENDYVKVLNKAFYIKDLDDFANDIKKASGITKNMETYINKILGYLGNQINKALGIPLTSPYQVKIHKEIQEKLVPMIKRLK